MASSRPPDGIETELNQSVPRPVQLRAAVKADLVHSGCLAATLSLCGWIPIVSSVTMLLGMPRTRASNWLAIMIIVLPLLPFALAGSLAAVGIPLQVLRECRLATKGRVVRVRVESIEIKTEKSAGQKIVLVWSSQDQPFEGAQTRRETVTWSGFLMAFPIQKPVFDLGQTVTVLEDPADPSIFVVYAFCVWQVLAPRAANS